MKKLINWAICTEDIVSEKIISSFSRLDAVNVVAYLSESGKPFELQHRSLKNVMNCKDINDLLTHRSIHAVFIASSTPRYFEFIKLCLMHGKHVLCERPFSLSTSQIDHLFQLANLNNLLLLEGQSTRFLPAMQKIRDIIKQGHLGSIQAIQANISLNKNSHEPNFLDQIEFSSGALSALGAFGISLADMVFSQLPVKMHSTGICSSTGVDENSFHCLEYADGSVVQISTGFNMSAESYATIIGNKGSIYIPDFCQSNGFELRLENQSNKWIECQFSKKQHYRFAINNMSESLRTNDFSDASTSADASLRMSEILNELKQQLTIMCHN